VVQTLFSSTLAPSALDPFCHLGLSNNQQPSHLTVVLAMADSSHVANEASARETETSSTPPVTEKEAVKTARADEQDLPESKEERRDVETAGDSRQPTGWKYKRISVGPIKLPPYASPGTQLVLVAFVCFLCPGMFNALGGLGGGGQVDPTVANNAGVALNSTFSIVGFFAGTLVNRLGIKLTLSIGGLGYCIYAASFLSYSHTANAGFNIFAGALLGVCAGLLWAAQGTIMMSYPQESSKGRYISWFWMIFNLGGVIGSLVGGVERSWIVANFHLDSPWTKHQQHGNGNRDRWDVHRIYHPHVFRGSSCLDFG
jgi:hypothetical protein